MGSLVNMKFDKEVQEFLTASMDDAKLFCWDFPAFYEKYKDFLPSYPEGEYKKILLKRVFETAHIVKDPSTMEYDWSETEEAFLNSIEDKLCRRAMFAFMLWAKEHPHEGGWIEYDFWNIMIRFFTAKEIDRIQHSRFLQSLVPYGFDMRVVGSKNPIVCFQIPVLDEGEIIGKVSGKKWPKCLIEEEEDASD